MGLRHGRPDRRRRRCRCPHGRCELHRPHLRDQGRLDDRRRHDQQGVDGAHPPRSTAPSGSRTRASRPPAPARRQHRRAPRDDASRAQDAHHRRVARAPREGRRSLRPRPHPRPDHRPPPGAASGIILESDHPTAGRLRQTRTAARFATPTLIRHGAPSLASTPPNYCRSSASPQPTSPPSPTNASSPQTHSLRPRNTAPLARRSGVLPVNQRNRRPHQPAHRRVACVVARRLLAFPEAEPARPKARLSGILPVNHKTHFPSPLEAVVPQHVAEEIASRIQIGIGLLFSTSSIFQSRRHLCFMARSRRAATLRIVVALEVDETIDPIALGYTLRAHARDASRRGPQGRCHADGTPRGLLAMM